MAFRSNRELEGLSVGQHIKLTAPLRVLKGEFSTGSVMEITGEPDARGESEVKDLVSGERAYVHPALSSYVPYDYVEDRQSR